MRCRHNAVAFEDYVELPVPVLDRDVPGWTGEPDASRRELNRKDASMAWIIARLKVLRTQRDSSGSGREEQFVYVGIMTYEKVNARCMKVANVSTFAPPP